MFNKIYFFIFFLAFIVCKLNSQSKKVGEDSLIQVYGIVLTGEDLKALPYVNIEIMGTHRGTVCNDRGIYSIVSFKGDTLKFSHVGYKTSYFAIPKNTNGNMLDFSQLMYIDTVVSPAVVIKSRPTKEQFERDFLNLEQLNSDLVVRAAHNARDVQNLFSGYRASFSPKVTGYNLGGVSSDLNILNVVNPRFWRAFTKYWKSGYYKDYGK